MFGGGGGKCGVCCCKGVIFLIFGEVGDVGFVGSGFGGGGGVGVGGGDVVLPGPST